MSHSTRNAILSRSQLSTAFMYNVISTEALSVHKPLAATVDKLSTFIGGVADGFRNTDVLGALDTLLHPDKKIGKVQDKALSVIQRTPYSDLISIRLPCVAGQSTTWLTFLTALEPGLRYVVDFYDTTLSQSTKFLAEVITAPDQMDSIARRYSISAVDYNQLIQDIARVVNNRSNKAELPYGKLVERNADFPSVMELTNRTNAALYNSNQDLVIERINHIQEQLRQISHDIRDGNTAYRMSSRNIDQLAKVSFNLAQGVEFYGLVLTLFTEHKRTFDQACQRLTKH